MIEARFNNCFCPPDSSVTFFVKPGLDTEEAGHLRHAAPDGGGVVPQALQPEGQLVPHLVGDDLVFRRLLHEANAGRLRPLVDAVQRGTLEQNFSCPDAMGRQNCFQLPEKR
jgi:hypothetical protein